MTPIKAGAIYEVLSPWAKADPVPLKGLPPRFDTLEVYCSGGQKLVLQQGDYLIEIY